MMASSEFVLEKVLIHVFHGGEFFANNLDEVVVYDGGECTEVFIDMNCFVFENLKDSVLKLGYLEDNIDELYYSDPKLTFRDSLFPIRKDDEIREMIDLFNVEGHVNVYVCHNKADDAYEFDDENEDGFCVNSDDEDDDELIEMRDKMKKHRDGIALDLHLLENEKAKIGEGSYEVDDNEPTYIVSDEANSPCSESDENSDTKKRKAKKKMKYPKYQGRRSLQLDVGMEFLHKREAISAIADYKALGGYSLKVAYSDKGRLGYKCMGNGCKWSIRIAKPKKVESWRIASIPTIHSCIRFAYQLGDRRITCQWLSDYYIETFRLFPTIKVREFKLKVKQDHGYKVSMCMCARTRNKALTEIIGDYKGEFEKLRDYGNEILKQNMGSTVKFSTTKNDMGKYIFKSIYICISSVKRGFLEGCRRVLSIDGCFIKGPWNGQILAAVGRDANNQMYPVAWGVVERETKEEWKWFISLLIDDLHMGKGNEWTIISDQQKGLVDAIAEYLPDAEHRLCARHVYANLRKTWKGLRFREVFWKLAKSTNEVHHQRYVQEMQDLDIDAWKFLEKKDPKYFCRLFFKAHAKCDSVDNNMAEIFNASILEARYKPIVSMLEDIYCTVMTRIANRQKWASKLIHVVSPRIVAKIDKGKELAKWWETRWCGSGYFSAFHGTESFTINICLRTCTCKSWQLSGIPCPHAIAVLRDEHKEPVEFVDECYNSDNLKTTYAYSLHPINGRDMWATSQGEEICAPVFKMKKRGNMKFKRRLEEGETKANKLGRVSKNGVSVHCSNCGKSGHNIKTCRHRVLTTTVEIPVEVPISAPTRPKLQVNGLGQGMDTQSQSQGIFESASFGHTGWEDALIDGFF